MSLTEDDKQARPQEYGFNPVSRRWVKRVSDVWLRLVKSGVVGETPEYLSDLASTRRDMTRKKNDLAFERRAAALIAPVPVPVVPAVAVVPVPVVPVPAKPSRADVRKYIVEVATDNISDLCDLDESDMESKLRELLTSGATPNCKPTSMRRTPLRRDTRYKHYESSDDDTATDY
jgi:hypothetical protein